MDATPTGSSRPSQKTPSRTPINREPPSTRRSAVHTPLDRTAPRDALNSIRRGLSASGGRRNAPTPHIANARRALNDRRTAIFTPGKKRRQSLMEQRESPMGNLRNLGRLLAPSSQVIASSSSSPPEKPDITAIQEEDEDDWDDDDDLPIDRPPRLSLPIDQEDDDDEDEPRPPRLSLLPDEDNYTLQSIEFPRREDPTRALSRLSRGSLGSVRVSDILPNQEPTEVGDQSDFFPGLLENLQAGVADDAEYERLEHEMTRQSSLGRESDFHLEIPAMDEQTTFLLSEPGPDGEQPSPVQEPTVTEAMAADAGALQEAPLDVEGSDDGGGFAEPGVFEDVSDVSESGSEPPGLDVTATTTEAPLAPVRREVRPKKKQRRISQHGIEYPALPPAFVKKVAQTALQTSGLSNQRISPETLHALMQASDWFFEQLGDDLGAYAEHAKRKTIEESDIVTLMRRQRQVSSSSTAFSLAQKHLPRELLQDLRMPMPQPAKRRMKRPRDDDTDEVGDVT